MKTMITLLFVSLLFCNCGGNNEAANEKLAANNSTVTETETATSGDGILGVWKLDIEARDENNNNILEDAERKKGFHNNYIYQFNANGTCRIQGVYNGTYTVKEEKGNKVLTVQRERIKEAEEKDPLPDVYHIKSLTATEMTLHIIDQAYGLVGTSFRIFKKVK
jgi:lipocalin-like protein